LFRNTIFRRDKAGEERKGVMGRHNRYTIMT
jgi:hypothetical protein